MRLRRCRPRPKLASGSWNSRATTKDRGTRVAVAQVMVRRIKVRVAPVQRKCRSATPPDRQSNCKKCSEKKPTAMASAAAPTPLLKGVARAGSSSRRQPTAATTKGQRRARMAVRTRPSRVSLKLSVWTRRKGSARARRARLMARPRNSSQIRGPRVNQNWGWLASLSRAWPAPSQWSGVRSQRNPRGTDSKASGSQKGGALRVQRRCWARKSR